MKIGSLILPLTAAGMLAVDASAQSTSGVSGPVVNPDYREFEYRVGFDPDADSFAHRFHYEQSLNGRFMVRGLVSLSDPGNGGLEFRSAGGQVFWQLSDEEADWQNGLRFDVTVREDGPTDLGVNWLSQAELGGDWRARLQARALVETGDGAGDGVFLTTRWQLGYRGIDGVEIGGQLFSEFGSTEDFGGFDEQEHQLGSFVSWSAGEDWSFMAGALFGMSEAAADTNLRFFVSRSF